MTRWTRRRKRAQKTPDEPSHDLTRIMNVVTPSFDIAVHRVGKKVPSAHGRFLGLPLTGPRDAKFVVEMAEIRKLETQADRDTASIRLG